MDHPLAAARLVSAAHRQQRACTPEGSEREACCMAICSTVPPRDFADEKSGEVGGMSRQAGGWGGVGLGVGGVGWGVLSVS